MVGFNFGCHDTILTDMNILLVLK